MGMMGSLCLESHVRSAQKADRCLSRVAVWPSRRGTDSASRPIAYGLHARRAPARHRPARSLGGGRMCFVGELIVVVDSLGYYVGSENSNTFPPGPRVGLFMRDRPNPPA